MSSTAYHGWNHRRAQLGGTDPRPHEAFHEIKVFGDKEFDPPVEAGDGAFYWAIQEDIGWPKLVLLHAQAYVSTVSSGGDIVVQIHNVTTAVDMLATRITIDAGDFTSYQSATPSVPDYSGTPPNNEVSTGDLLRIDVDSAGTAAKGLGVMVRFADRLKDV